MKSTSTVFCDSAARARRAMLQVRVGGFTGGERQGEEAQSHSASAQIKASSRKILRQIHSARDVSNLQATSGSSSCPAADQLDDCQPGWQVWQFCGSHWIASSGLISATNGAQGPPPIEAEPLPPWRTQRAAAPGSAATSPTRALRQRARPPPPGRPPPRHLLLLQPTGR